MTNGSSIFRLVDQIIGARFPEAKSDAGDGFFGLDNGETVVRVELDFTLLAEFAENLDGQGVLDLWPNDSRDVQQAKYVALVIEEIFEADASRSLREIRLERTRGGRVDLVDVRGAARAHRPDLGEGAYWSSDRE